MEDCLDWAQVESTQTIRNHKTLVHMEASTRIQQLVKLEEVNLQDYRQLELTSMEVLVLVSDQVA